MSEKDSIPLRDRIHLIIEKVRGYPREKKRFIKGTGYELNLDNPKSFNEKIIWRKINDRNPLFPIISDKYKVRDYVCERLGAEEAERILIPLLYETTDPKSIPFETLPEEYIIKANHSSNQNLIVDRDCTLTRKEIIDKCNYWLSSAYNVRKHEWAYQAVQPRRIIIEPLLRDSDGKLPKDYKFFVFHGKIELIQVDHGRFKEHTRTLYTSNWNALDITFKRKKGPITAAPKNFDRMKQLATELTNTFDFIRVDLYVLEGNIMFGELTLYPESGYGHFIPQRFDFELGKKWKTSLYGS